MTALFGAIVGVLDAGALWLIGVPLPLAWGFFSFITNFIPNIGFVIGIIPPALIALLDSGWEQMVLVIVVYSVLNVTIQTFIQPRFVGNSVGLSAEITFMSLVVWTFLLGAAGRAPRGADDPARAGVVPRLRPPRRLVRTPDRRPGQGPRTRTGGRRRRRSGGRAPRPPSLPFNDDLARARRRAAAGTATERSTAGRPTA